MANLSKTTLDAIGAAVAAAIAAQSTVSAPKATAEASAHYKAKDIACSASKPCAKTFRTAKGLAWHVANVSHA